MVNDVIISIREAESQAAAMLDQAKKQERSILAKARSDSSAAIAAGEKAAREQTAKMLAQAEDYARKRAAALVEQGQNKAAQDKEAALGRIGQAVSFILERAKTWQ